MSDIPATARRYDRLYMVVLALALVGSLAVTVFATKLREDKRIIIGDANGYYAWARSVLLDHDIDFRNDYQLLYPPVQMPSYATVLTPRGLVANKYPVGIAIIEVPGLLLGHAVALLSRSPADGASLPYQISVIWSLILYCIASFYLLYRALANFGVDRRWAAGFCTIALVGTNLIHYVVDAGMSHAGGVTVINALLFMISRLPKNERRVPHLLSLLMGVLVGLLFLIRNTNILLLPFLIVLAGRQRRWRTAEVLTALAGALGVAAIQPVTLYLLWGQWRLSTYPSEHFSAGLKGVVGTLFSHRHGLFVYNPWYAALLLLTGCAVFRRKALFGLAIAAVGSFALFAVANGTWWCWWFDHSFGNRAFIETLPMLSLVAGLEVSRNGMTRRNSILLTVLMSAVIALNLYLWSGYLTSAFPRDGSHSVAGAYLWLLHRGGRF
ncbi:MAG: hypothetical protein NTX53_08250 [candidate division WOR-3 bacterium]|nr:hypothetical protein [candidate division WOR-3 bacterium]